jgi:Retroviral aspartyl protease
MLEGRFGGASGAPYIQAHVSFPRLRLRGVLWLLVDTGADVTVLMPRDILRLGVDFRLLTNVTASQGIGGIARGYHETATISFYDRRFMYSYALKIELAAPISHNTRLPSLLGRDILQQWRLIVDKPENEIRCVPKTWSARSRV